MFLSSLCVTDIFIDALIGDFMFYDEIWRSRAENAKTLFALNTASVGTKLEDNLKGEAEILYDLINSLLAQDIEKVHKNLNSSSLQEVFETNETSFDSVFYTTDKDEMSYGDFISVAFDSLMHNNRILFYIMLYLIRFKSKAARRLFFDDIFLLKTTHSKLCFQLGKPDPYAHDHIEYPVYYYRACKECYWPTGGMLKAENVRLYLPLMSCNSSAIIKSKSYEAEFERCLKDNRVRKFITDCDSTINNPETYRENTDTDLQKIWLLLTKSLVVDFITTSLDWTDYLSISILKAMCGYASLFEDASIITYNESVGSFAIHIATLAKRTFETALSMSRRTSLSTNPILSFANFLINLYLLFPLSEIIDLLDEFGMDNMLDGIYDPIEHDLATKYETSFIANKMIDLSQFNSNPTSSKVIECWLDAENYKLGYTSVLINLQIAPNSPIKISFQFFDATGNSIPLGDTDDYKHVYTFSEPGHRIYSIRVLKLIGAKSLKYYID